MNKIMDLNQIINSEAPREEEVDVNLQNLNRVAHIRNNANIPLRYIDAKLEPINESQEKLLEKFKKAFKGKSSKDMSDLLIYGNIGTGKTYLTIGLLNKYIQAGTYCRYICEHDLLELYYQKDFDSFNAFKKVKFLVIDEVGKRELASWQLIQLEELITYRHNEMLPTIYITNMNLVQFKDFLGDRVIDRLKGNSIVTATMTGDSFRGKEIGSI